MFPLPGEDRRLKNKQEVVALLIDSQAAAYDTSFLTKNSLYHDTVGGQALVILTDISRATRLRRPGRQLFKLGPQVEAHRQNGTCMESPRGGARQCFGEERRRLQAHRAFWFEWQAQFPNSRLTH